MFLLTKEFVRSWIQIHDLREDHKALNSISNRSNMNITSGALNSSPILTPGFNRKNISYITYETVWNYMWQISKNKHS